MRKSFIADLPTRRRLALIGAIGIALAMLASLVAFNIFESWQVTREAEEALEEAMGWEPTSGTPAARTVEMIMLKADGTVDEDEMSWYSDLDLQVAAWCADHLTPGVVQRAVLDDAVCFVEVAETFWDESEEETGLFVAYVDTTGHSELVTTVNAVLVLILVVGSLGAGWAGWQAGVRIERADAAQKRFFENMSHELKTPLAAIVGYAEGMVSGAFAPEHAAASIVRESERMRTIVDQIMGLSRLEAGAVTLANEDLHVDDLVQDCLMPFEGIVRQKGLEVVIEVDDGCVSADAELMPHALENVLANAFRHAATLVRITFDGNRLTVANDGDLPTPEDVEHLFDRFHSSATDRGGTGIGLALTSEIVALHGWKVEARLESDMLLVAFVLA